MTSKPAPDAAALPEMTRADEPAGGGSTAIDALWSRVDAPRAEPAPRAEAEAVPALRTAQILRIERHSALLRLGTREVAARLAPDVDQELVALAARNGERVLVECEPGLPPLVVGVLHTKIPRELVLKAEAIRIEGEREVTMLSGRAAMRMRKDGDLELVATRISAASRGFFKLVGRMLRLN